MEMQEATPKQRANGLIRHQITEVISAMKEAEYSAEWKQNKRSYLMGIADTLYHMELITVTQHSQILDEINPIFASGHKKSTENKR